MIETLVQALKDEFSREVKFHPSIPSTVTAPAVIVSPGDPFLENSTAAARGVKESWDILVVVSLVAPERGLAQMRDLSLRVRDVVSAVGGHWESASGPRQSDPDATQIASFNRVTFRYTP